MTYGTRGERDQRSSEQTDTDDELRAVGFRLREIQRSLSVRAEQENRRLQADGIEPATDSEFFRANDEAETE